MGRASGALASVLPLPATALPAGAEQAQEVVGPVGVFGGLIALSYQEWHGFLYGCCGLLSKVLG